MELTFSKIAESFSKAAAHYEKYADVQGALSRELLEKVVCENLAPRKILDVGCGTGNLLQGLRDNYSRSSVIGLDLGFGMARAANRKGCDSLVADARCLPFRDESFDLILSNATYQWVRDFGGAFFEAFRVLQKGGSLILSCFGRDTLKELRACFGIKNNILPSKEQIYSGLESADFKDIDVQGAVKSKYFDNLIDILTWLKYVGANRISERQPFLTPGKLSRMNDFYCSNYRNNTRVYATFEVIWVKAKKDV